MVLVLRIKSFCSLILILFFGIHRIGGDGIRIPLSIYEYKDRSDNNCVEFYGTISIGTPPQKINVSFTFTKVYPHVPSINCNSAACRDQNNGYYNHKVSKTFRIYQSENTGREIHDPQYWHQYEFIPADDTFTVGNIQIQNVTFDAKPTTQYDNTPYHGYVALGYTTRVLPGTLLEHCEEIGLKNKFSFYTDFPWNNNTSELMLCGEDKTKFRGNLQYINASRLRRTYYEVLGSYSPWDIAIQSVLLEYNDGCVPIMALPLPVDFEINPASQFIYGPKQYIEKIFNALNARTSEANGSADVEVDCKTIHTLPNIIFRNAEMKFTFTGNDYIQQMTQNDQQVCKVLLQANRYDKDTNWTLGNVFNRKYYTVVDIETNRIGFAQSIHGSASTAIINKVLLITVLVLLMIY